MVRRVLLSSILALFAFALVPRPSAGCSVTCRAGYYACCDEGLKECKCVPDSEDKFCNSGGKGASSCGIASAASLSAEQRAGLDAFIASLEEDPGTLNDPQQKAWQAFLNSLGGSPEP